MNLLSLLSKLISFPSVTPDDAGCQTFMMDYLTRLGFNCEPLDNPPVSNFFARLGDEDPLFLFAGHTDVVSPGPLSLWSSSPFDLTEVGDQLIGRGTADMKGSLAAMLICAQELIQHSGTNLKGSLGFLITSGEEGDFFHQGTPYVMDILSKRNINPRYCIVGEPTSVTRLGDVIKIGRRGSLSCEMRILGKQGHVAYPHLAENPIHLFGSSLNALINQKLDTGNEYFPPSSLQCTKVISGGNLGNVIPADLNLAFNIRFSNEVTATDLKSTIETLFDHLPCEFNWRLNGEPYLTKQGKLLEVAKEVIQSHCKELPELSTSGGTSDGRFIAPYQVEVIELGPSCQSIHQTNESVSLRDLLQLSKLYQAICERLLSSHAN